MAFGSRGAKDFGLSGNLTLPKGDAAGFSDPGMPEEKEKKHARFAFDQNQDKVRTKQSGTIVQRFKRIFSRKSRKEGTPYVISTTSGSDEGRMRRTESDPEISVARQGLRDEEGTTDSSGKGNGGPPRQMSKTDRRARAQSTAFEHFNDRAVASEVHIVLKYTAPDGRRTGARKLILRRNGGPSSDGLGLHLSGGLPPVTVTYVKPGSQAERERIRVGDVILELNGMNCRKKVDISQLLELKISIQADRQEDTSIDEASWKKIKTLQLQDDLESGTSTNVITKLDSTTDEDERDLAEVKIKEKKKKKNGKSKKAQKCSDNADVGEPLAASSPIKKESPETKGKTKKSKKSKKVKGISVDGDDGKEISAIQNGNSGDGSKGAKSGRKNGKKVSSSSIATKESSSEVAKISPDSKKKKNGKKVSSSSIESSSEVAKISPDSKKKKNGKKVSSSSIATKESSSEVAKISPDSKKKKKRKKLSQSAEEIIAKEEGHGDIHSNGIESTDGNDPTGKTESKGEDISLPDPSGIARDDRHRRSSSPKSRYHAPPEKEEMSVVTIGVIKKKEKKSKAEGESKKEDKKRIVSKSSEEKSKKKESKKKGKEKENEKPKDSDSTPPAPVVEERVDLAPPPSAAISGSIESDTLSFVSPKKGSKNSLKKQKGKKKEESENNKLSTLPRARRRKSEDQTAATKPPVTRSTSYSHLAGEESKALKKGLRHASKSQSNVSTTVDPDLKVDIDANIKVKKSGVLKEDRSAARPSIFNQSSSPEPEEVTISSGAVEDNILDPEFKVKKSGLVVGRKTSNIARPSILDEMSSTEATDVQPGEMKYNMKLTEELDMDISVIPETSPTLGVAVGRTRIDAINRSLTKRRPPSLRHSVNLDSKEEKDQEGFGTAERSTSRTSAARKLFEEKQDSNAGKYNSRFTKSVEMPVKKLSIGGQLNEDMLKKVEVKPAASPVNVRARANTINVAENKENTGSPSWMSIAQGRQKRTSVENNKPAVTKVSSLSTATTTASTTTTTKTKEVPDIGHVAKRLAMFQNH